MKSTVGEAVSKFSTEMNYEIVEKIRSQKNIYSFLYTIKKSNVTFESYQVLHNVTVF